MKKITFVWAKCTKEQKQRIKERFNITDYTSVNGESECVISEEDYSLFLETCNRGFIQIRNKRPS